MGYLQDLSVIANPSFKQARKSLGSSSGIKHAARRSSLQLWCCDPRLDNLANKYWIVTMTGTHRIGEGKIIFSDGSILRSKLQRHQNDGAPNNRSEYLSKPTQVCRKTQRAIIITQTSFDLSRTMPPTYHTSAVQLQKDIMRATLPKIYCHCSTYYRCNMSKLVQLIALKSISEFSVHDIIDFCG